MMKIGRIPRSPNAAEGGTPPQKSHAITLIFGLNFGPIVTLRALAICPILG